MNLQCVRQSCSIWRPVKDGELVNYSRPMYLLFFCSLHFRYRNVYLLQNKSTTFLVQQRWKLVQSNVNQLLFVIFLFCKRQSIYQTVTGIKYYKLTVKTLASYWRKFSLFNKKMIVINSIGACRVVTLYMVIY